MSKIEEDARAEAHTLGHMKMRHSSATAFSGIEPLETRIAPATHIWIGPATGGLWNNAANWNGGVPTTGEAGGTIVQFNGGISSTDNIAGLVIGQIHFAGDGNIILGAGGVTLGINGVAPSTNILNDAGENAVDDSLPLNISGATTYVQVTSGRVHLDSNISGSVGMALIEGSTNGTLTLAGINNTFAGGMTVRDGILELNSTGVNTAIPGGLTIGNNSGPGASAVVRLLQSQEIANSAPISILNDGLLDLNGCFEQIGSLSLTTGATSSSAVTTGAGLLTLGGDVTVSGTGAVGATISGHLNLGGATRAFTVADGAAGSDLIISADISGTGGVTKAGTGTLEFANPTAHTYTADTLVSDGRLLLNSSTINGAVPAALSIGDGLGAAGSALVQAMQPNQIADTTNVSLQPEGKLLLSGVNDVINYLYLQSGTTTGSSVESGVGTLGLKGNVQVLVSGTGAFPAVITGHLDLDSAMRTFSVDDGAAGSDLIVAASITGTVGYFKNGAGTMEVQNAGPAGSIVVSTGTLLLNSSGVDDAVPTGLTIGGSSVVKLARANQIADSAYVSMYEGDTLDLNGFDETIGSLFLRDGVAASSLVTTGAGTLRLAGETTVTQPPGGAVASTISGHVDFQGHNINVTDSLGATDLLILAEITGTQGYTLAGYGSSAGTMEVRSSSVTGAISVLGGRLLLNSAAGDAIKGDLTIGESGGVTPASVELAQSSQILDSVNVTVRSPGSLALSGFDEAINNLTLQAGSTSGAIVNSGVGTLTLNGTVTVGTTSNGGFGAVIAGKLQLNPGMHVFQIANGNALSDLRIVATMVGPGGIVKTGLGTLSIANTPDNTYTGLTYLNDGVVLLGTGGGTDSLSTPINVGNDVGNPGSAVLRYAGNNALKDNTSFTIFSDGLLDFHGFTDTVGNISVFEGGTVNLDAASVSSGHFNLAEKGTLSTLDDGKLNVTGFVNIAGRLDARSTTALAYGGTRTIIDNDGTDAVTGTFSGLPEGAVFGTATGLFRISYTGGTGNDVVLTSVDASAVLTIAPGGKSATFTDVDGDLVKVKTTKGVLTADNFRFGGMGGGLINGYQLQELLLNDPQFAGAAITFTAKPTALGGDGHVNVGWLKALNTDLASLTLPGDLGMMHSGDADAKKPGIGKLTVDSLGEFDAATQLPGGTQFLDLRGVGSFTVKGNVRGTTVFLGQAGTVTIGGSLLGSKLAGGGNLFLTSAKKIAIGGSLVSADVAAPTGQIVATDDLGAVTIGHDLVGMVKIASGGRLGAVVIGGAVTGTAPSAPAIISGAGSATAPKSGPDTAISSLTIGHGAENLLVRAGFGTEGAAFSADAAIGKITIGGDLRTSDIIAGTTAGTDGLYGTADDAKVGVMRDLTSRFSTIASLVVKGRVLGTTGSVSTSDCYGIVAEQIASGKIAGQTLKLKSGPRNVTDTFALGYASGAPGGWMSDFFLREINT